MAALLVFVLLAAPALRLARRTTPAERAAAGFFLLTGLGFSLRMAAVRGGIPEGALATAVNTAGHAALSCACVALFTFTRIVFRPTERWAAGLQRVGSVAAGLGFGALFLDGGTRREQAASVLLVNALRTASYAWCFAESLRYWRMMRRRVAMGLADATVANRFGLWCTWTGALSASLGGVLITRLAGRASGAGMELFPTFLAAAKGLVLVGMLVSGAAIWLSFFPPARYLDWVERRAEVRSD